jgi:hypothetical protein
VFIRALEDLRIQILNESRINMMEEKSEIINHALNEMLKSDLLTQKWMQCFNESDIQEEIKVRYFT